MKFAGLYPYRSPHPNDLGKNFDLWVAQEVDNPLVAGKDEVDRLFRKLRMLDVPTAPMLGAERAQAYVDECNEIINRQLLIAQPFSRLIVASLFAAKMEIYRRNNLDEKIRKEFALFHRAIRAASDLPEVPQEEKFIWRNSTLKSCDEVESSLILHLESVLPLRSEARVQDLSVPDALAAASVICGTSHNLADIRKMYHELWKIESLQPLLTVVAHATQGTSCDFEGKVQLSEPVKIIFSDNLLRGYFGGDASPGLSLDGKLVMFSFKGFDERGIETSRDDREVRGTIIHEFHHLWERLYYQNKALPYPSSVDAAAASAVKTRLEVMLQEAAAVPAKSGLKIASRFDAQGFAAARYQPFDIFDFARSYEDNEETRHAEVVVRVGNALGTMVENGNPTKSCDERRVFEIMRSCGLEECVKFFGEEVEMMKAAARSLAAETGLHFEVAPSLTEIPTCADYDSTPLHEAVRRRDAAAVKKIISSGFVPATKDSLGQNALELAINCDDPATVLAFCEVEEVHKMLGENLPMLRKLATYLAAKSCEEKDGAGQAAEAFMQLRNQPGLRIEHFFALSAVAREFANLAMVESIKVMTLADFEEQLARGTIKIPVDHLGNNFMDYCQIAERRDLGEYVWQNCYNSVCSQALLKCNPLQLAAKTNDPAKFLKEVEAMAARRETLPERLDLREHNDSLLKYAAIGMLEADRVKNDARLSQSITLSVRLVELGCDPFAITCGDERSFVEFLADQLPPPPFTEIATKFPEETAKRAEEIFAKRAQARAEKTASAVAAGAGSAMDETSGSLAVSAAAAVVTKSIEKV